MQVTRFLSSAKRRRQGGFTLLEVTLSLVIFTMMSLMFSAVLPVAVRGARHGNNYSQATALAQRKIDQLRSAGYNALPQAAQLQGLGIINGVNANGSYDFTAADNLGSFFPAGSTGTIAFQDRYNGLPSGQVAQVTVTIKWGGTVPGTYTVNALLVSMVHQ